MHSPNEPSLGLHKDKRLLYCSDPANVDILVIESDWKWRRRLHVAIRPGWYATYHLISFMFVVISTVMSTPALKILDILSERQKKKQL